MPRRERSVRAPWLVALAVMSMAAAGADAGERITFKNGHVITAESSRVDEETGMVFLTLGDGSEIGFPMGLIEEVEGGKPVERSRYGRKSDNPDYFKLMGYRNWAVQTGQKEKVLSQGVLTQEMMGKKALTVGFSYRGSGFAFSGSPAARAVRRGFGVWAGKERLHGGSETPVAGTPVPAGGLGAAPSATPTGGIRLRTVEVNEATDLSRKPDDKPRDPK